MKTLFVTASGTEVGKTFVCCRLIQELDANRLRVIKPIATGFDPDNLAESDTGQLLLAQNCSLGPADIEATTPWRFRAPLSPDMAADREGSDVPFDRLIEFCKPSKRSASGDLTIIEGIGGVMVPIDSEHTVLDWITALDPVVLLVVGSYLGTLSHTLTALHALRTRGIEPVAIIVNESAEQPVAVDATADTIRRFAGTTPVRVLRRDSSPDDDESPLAALLETELA